MSFKMSFKDMDIQMLSQKIRRLEALFSEDSKNITDQYLGIYNTLTKRIKELKSEYLMANKRIFSIDVGDVKVTGKITQLEKHYIEVDIISPYVNWKNYRVSTGPGRKHTNFLIIYKERSEELLLNSYLKLEMIDESIDRIVNVYSDMEEEIRLVSKLEDTSVKERTISKLKNWFYHDFIFTSSITGKVATISDEPQIEKIIKVYRSEKRKIYLK